MRNSRGGCWGRLGESADHRAGLALSEGEREGKRAGRKCHGFPCSSERKDGGGQSSRRVCPMGLRSPGHWLGATRGKRALVQRRPWVSQPSSRALSYRACGQRCERLPHSFSKGVMLPSLRHCELQWLHRSESSLERGKCLINSRKPGLVSKSSGALAETLRVI